MTVYRNLTQSYPITPNHTQSHPITPNHTQSHPITPNHTQSHPISPNHTQSPLFPYCTAYCLFTIRRGNKPQNKA
ncbi:hypothetical protein [Myroides sp. DW712]|uniref:hypothetical protein n=1 Tax=Myroides sp. DW712 TaxID=3389800 RepID=UPI00397C6001